MSRTGRAAKLSEHLPEPFVDMHAHDALRSGIREGELVRVTTNWGSLAARLRTSGEIARGSVFVPIHWSAANASDARVGALVNPVVDPISGEPEFKHTPARVEPLRVEWHGVICLRDGAQSPESATGDKVTWWARVRGDGFLRYEIAGRNKLFDGAPDARAKRESWARKMLGVPLEVHGGDYLDYEDASSGIYRAAFLVDGRIVACVFLSARPQLLPSREWLADLLTKKRIDDTDRRGLLAGRPLAAGGEVGPVVCSCFRVGRKTIAEAIRCHGLKSAAQVGAHLKAGTNCGSCMPEISALIAANLGAKQPELA